jgi:dTDP-4-amino-4,6-dideoxygalactose transaminase
LIPLVDLAAQYRSFEGEIDSAIRRVIENSAFIQGPDVAAFEAAFSRKMGAAHAIGVASGTDALYLAIRALDIGAGDEVITVVNTWISTAFAASQVGARVVLVDIDPDTHQMDVAALRRAITPRTKAVIPVHLYGHPAPMAEIVALCRPKGIRIVEDVAQAPLAALDGKLVGTFGDVACFSFYPSKNLGCYGDGGAVITDDAMIAGRVRQLADYGQTTRFHHGMVGFNSRLDTIQAAVLNAKLPYLDSWTEARRRNARLYDERLRPLRVKRPIEAVAARAVYHLYVIEIERRDECLAFLRENQVLAQVHYPQLIHAQPCYASLGYSTGAFPVAEAAVERILSLPMYPELTEAQIDRVVELIESFLTRAVRR